MNQSRVYYFDNNATTRIAPEVLDAMLPFLTESWGNASSPYQMGREAAMHVQNARVKVAALVNANPEEIVFTSCGTEGNNTAIHSALVSQPTKRHVVTTAVEHSAIIRFCESLQRRGYEVTYVPVDSNGSLDLQLLERAILPNTAIVSVMWANNETGVIFPIKEIADICHGKGVPFHTDAVQTPGKITIDVRESDVDFLSLSAHKCYAPKGIGMLYVRQRSAFHPYIIGGHQESGRRGGTESVADIVAFGRAAELAMSSLSDSRSRVRALRERLENAILNKVPDSARNGASEPRLPNTSNISFRNIEAEAALTMLDQIGICVSSGSACTTGSLAPSHVLTAMGLDPGRARGSIRFSLGILNTDQDIDYLLEHLPGIVGKLRAMP